MSRNIPAFSADQAGQAGQRHMTRKDLLMRLRLDFPKLKWHRLDYLMETGRIPYPPLDNCGNRVYTEEAYRQIWWIMAERFGSIRQRKEPDGQAPPQ